MNDKPSRRVYAREFKERLGVGDTWLRQLENVGRIPRGRKDPGTKRKWWTSEEVDAIVAGDNNPPAGA